MSEQVPKNEGERAEGAAVEALASHLEKPEVRESLRVYWQSNIRWTLGLLAVWALVGLGCGILFADRLNAVKLPGTGYPLGFWFAQQGSIIAFVLLILIYCIVMNRLDAKHHRDLAHLVHEGEESP